jgi:hypothetical protein
MSVSLPDPNIIVAIGDHTVLLEVGQHLLVGPERGELHFARGKDTVIEFLR